MILSILERFSCERNQVLYCFVWIRPNQINLKLHMIAYLGVVCAILHAGEELDFQIIVLFLLTFNSLLLQDLLSFEDLNE